jgi:hypothetical protein
MSPPLGEDLFEDAEDGKAAERGGMRGRGTEIGEETAGRMPSLAG